METESLVGRKMRGFRFESVKYHFGYDQYIGKTAIVKWDYGLDLEVMFLVDGRILHYPKSLAIEHLVPEAANEIAAVTSNTQYVAGIDFAIELLETVTPEK